MKKIKKIFTAIMSMVLVIAMVGTGCVFANSPDSIDTVGDGTIAVELGYAADFVEGKDLEEETGLFKNAVLSINFSEDEKNGICGSVQINIDGKELVADVEGNYETIGVDSIGKSAVVEGTIDLAKDNEILLGDHTPHIILNMVYDEDDIFAVVTLGIAGENEVPLNVFFGKYTDDVRSMFKAEVERIKAEQDVAEIATALDPGFNGPRLNTAVTYASSAYTSSSGYRLVGIHLYRQLNAYIGADTQIESKANSYSSNAISYANNVLSSTTGGNTIFAIPDKVYTQLKTSTYSPNSIVVMSYSPTSSITTFNLSILSWALSFFGVSASFPSIILSSTSVTAGNQEVDWVMYKSSGINNLDGTSYSNKNGMPARLFAHITGGSSANSQTAYARACMRYMYVYEIGFDDYLTGYFTTDYTIWTSGSYTVNPI